MRGDQRVRTVGVVAVVAAYVAFVGLNGHSPVDAGFVGEYDPFAIVSGVIIILSLPETLNYIPYGPTHPAEQPQRPSPPEKPNEKK